MWYAWDCVSIAMKTSPQHVIERTSLRLLDDTLLVCLSLYMTFEPAAPHPACFCHMNEKITLAVFFMRGLRFNAEMAKEESTEMIQLTMRKMDVSAECLLFFALTIRKPALFLLGVLSCFGLKCATQHVLPFPQPHLNPSRPHQTIDVINMLAALCQCVWPHSPYILHGHRDTTTHFHSVKLQNIDSCSH